MKLLECFLCCISVCGCKNIVTRAVAFYPPSPTGYRIFRTGKTFKILLFDENENIVQPLCVPWVRVSVIMFTSSLKSLLPALFYRNMHAEYTIIFAHGNSTDIGIMYNYISDLVIQLKANILLFEYSGYGEATGKPSEDNLYADIRAAYDYLISIDIDSNSIVLYGQSIGSAAVCDLATQVHVAGMILHSPLASGLHFIKDNPKKTTWYNAFPNIKKIGEVKCPVFIMHGTKDLEIPSFHGECLANEVKVLWPAWFPEAGHNDIEEKFRKLYLQKLEQFLVSLRENKNGKDLAQESEAREYEVIVENLESEEKEKNDKRKTADIEEFSKNQKDFSDDASPTIRADLAKIIPSHT